MHISLKLLVLGAVILWLAGCQDRKSQKTEEILQPKVILEVPTGTPTSLHLSFHAANPNETSIQLRYTMTKYAVQYKLDGKWVDQSLTFNCATPDEPPVLLSKEHPKRFQQEIWGGSGNWEVVRVGLYWIPVGVAPPSGPDWRSKWRVSWSNEITRKQFGNANRVLSKTGLP